MRWLVTVQALADQQQLQQGLEKLGCKSIALEEAVPLENDEMLVACEGPADLPKRARGVEAVVGVYPDSSMDYSK